MMHRLLLEDLQYEADKPELKWSHLANSYVSNYKLSRPTLEKHGILKKLKSYGSVVILSPEKGNSVVILDQGQYENAINEVINYINKFKKLLHDGYIKREAKLHCKH